MIRSNKLRETLALFGVLVLLAPSSLEARNRKGDKFLKQAHVAEERKEYDKALELYEQALSQDPADPGYQLGMRRVRMSNQQAAPARANAPTHCVAMTLTRHLPPDRPAPRGSTPRR